MRSPVSVLGRLLVVAATSTASVGAPTAARGSEPAASESSTTEPAGPEPDPEESTDPALLRAKTLYEEGTVFYSAAQYGEAIEKFTEALRIISTEAESFDPDARGYLLYNLATAHRRAYNIDQDVSHLRIARDLFERIETEAETFGYSQDAVEQARAARDEVTEQLAQIAAEERKKTEVQAPAPQPTAGADRQPPDTARRLTIAGGALMATGLLTSSIWMAGIVVGVQARDELGALDTLSAEQRRLDTIDRGELADKLGIAGAIVSSTLFTTGVVLLAVGQTRAKRKPSNVACHPVLDPRLAGAGCVLRF